MRERAWGERRMLQTCCTYVARMLYIYDVQAASNKREKMENQTKGPKNAHTPSQTHTHPTTPHHECATLATKEDRGGA